MTVELVRTHLATKTFASPRRYIQGPGVIKLAGKQIRIFGKKALIIGGSKSLDAVTKAGLLDSLNKADVNYHVERFGGECTRKQISSLAKAGEEEKCDIVIATGGGKSMDTGKAVAEDIGAEAITVPSQAATTGAATSAICGIYSEDHVFEETRFVVNNPAMLVVDSKVIAEAPVRYLIAGIGDGASEKFEGEACYRTGSKNLIRTPECNGYATTISLTLCKLAYEKLREYGELAIDGVLRKAVTPPLETIIEAIFLWTALGFEGTGLAAAHSIHNGITSIGYLIPETRRPLHGELVNFGTCTQLMLEDRSRQEILEHFEWSHKVGLPITLDELGFPTGQPSDEDLRKAAERSCSKDETIHNMPFDVTPEIAFDAMKAADELGKKVAAVIPRPSYLSY